VQILAISADSLQQSATFADKLKAPFPMLSDPGMDVMSAYGVADAKRDIAVPALFVVSRGGIIVWRHVGESITDRPSYKELLRVIENML